MSRRRFLKRYAQWGFPQDPDSIKLTTTLRINTLLTQPDTLTAALDRRGAQIHAVPYLRHGYTIQAPFSPGATIEYLLGWYYLQESASQLPVQILDPQPDTTVLDACAAPGSKTTQLSQWMQGRGSIVAMDASAQRLQSLINNIERMHCPNVTTVVKDARFCHDLDLRYDAILIDAPCSGNFANDPKWFDKRSIHDIADKARTQQQIISSAWKTLKPGCRMVYSTCSLECEENEDIVEWALDTLKGCVVAPIDIDVGSPGLTDRTRSCLRLWPTQHGTQGFFIALLEKQASVANTEKIQA